MGYIREIERQLRVLIEAGDTDVIVRYVKEIVVESFKNGILSGKLSMAEKQAEKQAKESLEE